RNLVLLWGYQILFVCCFTAIGNAAARNAGWIPGLAWGWFFAALFFARRRERKQAGALTPRQRRWLAAAGNLTTLALIIPVVVDTGIRGSPAPYLLFSILLMLLTYLASRAGLRLGVAWMRWEQRRREETANQRLGSR